MMYLGDKAVGINSLRNTPPSDLLNLTYGQGLSRNYNNYSDSTNRARTTNDIQISADEGIQIIINDNNYQAAIGAWDKENHNNILYGNWNTDLTYFPSKNTLIKIVFRDKTDRVLNLDEIPENAIIIKIIKAISTYELHT